MFMMILDAMEVVTWEKGPNGLVKVGCKSTGYIGMEARRSGYSWTQWQIGGGCPSSQIIITDISQLTTSISTIVLCVCAMLYT